MTAETQRRVAGRYHLLEAIGRGGMGVVWRAHDELLDRPVAVKEVLYHAISEEDRVAFNRRTIREARAAGRLDHPSVVVVHDVIEEDGRPWIVMQLVRSRSLGEVVRADGPLDPRTVAGIGAQILGALRAAHAAGVLHRDVKPENVLLTEDGRVVLTDFGIATMPDETALTTTGNLSGTPAFMPPERLRGHPAVPQSDLWSLGATLYAAVEGRPPFDRGAPVPTMAAVLNDQPEPTRLAGPLGPVLQGLLRKEPEERMPAAAAAEALRQVAAGPPGRAPRARRSPGSRLALVAGLPLLLAVIGAAGWYGYRELAGTAAGPSTPISPSVTATSSAAVPSSSPPSPTATRTPAPSLPDGWRTYTDPRLGFSLALPDGWAVSDSKGARVWFRPPGSQSYLLVDLTPWTDGDPLAALRDVEKQALAEGRLPGYELLELRSVAFRARPAADWEFTWKVRSAPVHVLDRAFNTASGRQVTIYLQSPQDDWKEESAYFDRFAKTFRLS
ncbi:protein kinase domain-containing protein [Sphaerisporangium viridialbum]|uniref:serine/threonine-protein kinase n=1 Tax=Sphaerisporangium viridialbum TaxID=46189 RepID=UPI003C78B915